MGAWGELGGGRNIPRRIARRLGIGTLWRYSIGRLTLAESMTRLGRQIGINAVPVAASDGRAAIDVDTPEDLALVRDLVSRE